MQSDRMQRQRFEIKYVVNEATAQKVPAFVGQHLGLDPFGAGKPHNSYPVNSLYLDSGDLKTFYQWVNADSSRFKLRVRFYDEQPETPAFLEIKRRLVDCILKQRCSVKKGALAYVLAGQFPPSELVNSSEPKHQAALQEFIRVVQRLRARPKILVTYLREAYLDGQNNAVRVTLDRRVRIAPRSTVDFSLSADRFLQPFGQSVIVEVKFTNRFPSWAGQMTRALGMTRGGAAKYCEGVANLWHPQYVHWQHGLDDE